MYKYFHFKSQFVGERYFKVDTENKKVIQICLDRGTEKRGRVHCVGIYQIAYSSFMGSYYWFFGRKSSTEMKLTTPNQYKQAVTKVMTKLLTP